jgi:hypothetical protein
LNDWLAHLEIWENQTEEGRTNIFQWIGQIIGGDG